MDRLSEAACQELNDWQHQVNSNENIPGKVITYTNHPKVVVYVTQELYDAIRSGEQPRGTYPMWVGGYAIHYSVLPGPPVPQGGETDRESANQ